MKRLLTWFGSIFILCFCAQALSQVETEMISSEELVKNLNKVLDEVKKSTDVPVLFPSIIPKDPVKTYYASADLSAKKFGISYLINIDSTPQCNGVHACNVGFVKAEKGGSPQLYKDMQNKEITALVILMNNVKAYYTPSHAMGDYFPASIQWQQNNVLYTISWPTNKDALIKMGNSAIAAGSASRK